MVQDSDEAGSFVSASLFQIQAIGRLDWKWLSNLQAWEHRQRFNLR
jgi:hypothetical protein